MTAARFADTFDSTALRRDLGTVLATTPERVRIAVAKPRRDRSDLMALISPAAGGFLEAMAQEAERLTRRRFGRVVQMYIPLYLSSECTGDCPYCGFRRDLGILRRTLSDAEILRESDRIAAMGFSHLLLVAGAAPSLPPRRLAEIVRILKPRFASVGVEVRSLSTDDYRLLREAGVDSVTLYQETYDPDLYRRLHRTGPKADFGERLDAPERMAEAGIRRINLGALLGLGDWRFESLALADHLDHLAKHHWTSYLSLSFPRITEAPPDFSYTAVPDRDFVQMILAFRLRYPDLNLVLSTRERPEMRRHLVRLAVTQISAGSNTAPGGYSGETGHGQFSVCDHRPPEEVAAELRSLGLEPVWKDWDARLA